MDEVIAERKRILAEISIEGLVVGILEPDKIILVMKVAGRGFASQCESHVF